MSTPKHSHAHTHTHGYQNILLGEIVPFASQICLYQHNTSIGSINTIYQFVAVVVHSFEETVSLESGRTRD